MIQPIKLKRIEHHTESQIIQAINDLGGYVIKNQASSMTGKGRPDLSACIKGRYYAIEVKRPTAQIETTPYQLAMLTRVAQAGGQAFYSKTADMFDLKKYQAKTIKIKPKLTVKQVLPYLRQTNIMLMQIINEQTMKIYQRK